MQSKIRQSVISGIVATIIMTLLMVVGGAIGMPKMNPPDMLSAMMGISVAMGWVLHFVIGIIFATGYVFFFNKWLKKIRNKFLKGTVYGIIVFIIAQIAIPVLEAMFGSMPAPQGSMALLMIGSILGHVIFGIVIALLVKPVTPVLKQVLK